MLSAFVALALVAGWLWVVYGSGLLAAERVQVVGTHRLTPAQVSGAAAVPPGLPLARVDLTAVRTRVGQLAQVEAVAAERVWPHTVRITVEERVPVAAVHQGGRWWLVDHDAVVVTSQDRRPKRLPKLSVDHPEPGDPTALAALAVVESLPGVLPAKRAADARLVTATSPDAVRLHLPKHVTVVWGSADQAAEKARALAALRKAQPDARRYDVSTPDVVTVRP